MLTIFAIKPVTSKGNYSDKRKDKDVAKKKSSESERKSDIKPEEFFFIGEKPKFDFVI